MNDHLSAGTLEQLQRERADATIGHTIAFYPRVSSTNDRASEQARAGSREGVVFLADEQTAGRGRLGRAWLAPPGTSLLLSVLLRPRLGAPDAFVITMLAGVALCAAVETVAQVPALLKWPNDLMVPAPNAVEAERPLRKAAGILCEVDFADRRVAWAVMGLGVNVNWAPTGMVDGQDLSQIATSLSLAAGRPIDRLDLLRSLLEQIEGHYQHLHHDLPGLFNAWRNRLAMLGQPVRLRLASGEITGIAEDVEASGALRLRTADGRAHTITSGDIVPV